MYSRGGVVPSAAIDDLNSRPVYRDPLSTQSVRPGSSGPAAATALVTDMMASRRVAWPASTSAIHYPVKTSITLKQ